MNCLFPISYTLDHVEDDKELVSWPHPPLLLGRCQVSSFLRVVCISWRKESYFSKNKGMKFPCFWRNILFMVPGTLESNLHECQDLIFFILYIVFCIFVHLSTPDCEFSADKLILSLVSLIYQRIALYVKWARHYTKCFLNIKTHLILITSLWFSNFYYLFFRLGTWDSQRLSNFPRVIS